MILEIDTQDKDFKKGDLVGFYMDWGKYLTIGVIAYSPVNVSHSDNKVAIRYFNPSDSLEKALYDRIRSEPFLNSYIKEIIGNDIPYKNLVHLPFSLVVKIKFK
jgi:hypothetical protein